MNSKTAEDCFRENFRLFGSDSARQPEKFNLYNGLANLASAISGIEQSLHSIDYRLTLLEQKIR